MCVWACVHACFEVYVSVRVCVCVRTCTHLPAPLFSLRNDPVSLTLLNINAFVRSNSKDTPANELSKHTVTNTQQ